MRKALKVLIVLGAAVLMLPATVRAQAAIAGVARDASGAVIPGVTVEAASPVLIEKVRTAVTDGNGRYQLIDLRPGAYTVTFTLSGFNTVKREGVTLAGAGTVTIDADMRVGALEETITVTGETPLVDVQSTTRQAVLDRDVIEALPSSRNYVTLARMIPGTVGGGTDVGGSAIQDVGGSVTVHGSREQDQRVTLNGINTMTLQAGGNIGGQIPDVGSAAEVTVDTSSLSADLPTGGVRINFIPRDGGNTFTNSTFFTFSNQDLQGDNFTDALKAAGLPAPNRIVKNYDINQSIGGPIKRDKVWFWASFRYNRADYEATVLVNKNAYKPTEWLYAPDAGNPGVNEGRVQQNSVRVTWQASPRHKIAGTYKVDRWCNCPMYVGVQGSSIWAPEAASDRRFPRLRQEHLEWTSPFTSRLLFEVVGMHLFERWGNMDLRPEADGGSLDDPAQAAVIPQMIGVLEQSTGITYRMRNTFNNTVVPNYSYRAAASYVAGSHNFKVGFNRTHGYLNMTTYNFQPYQYRFNNGVPNQVTLYATPYTARSHQNNDVGVFAQDRWTMDRLTVNLALRFDYFGTSFPEQQVGPGLLLPTRNLTFPAQDNLGWKDLTYRTGFSYDLRGNGKTAVKVALNKYLRGQTLNTLGTSPNPVNAMVTSTTRSWNDRNRNYVPDCNLTNPAAQTVAGGDICGQMANVNFGTTVPQATFDKDLLTGWGNREANWEFSAGVQHEVVPRVSVDVGFFRRIWKNFQVTDDLRVAAEDFTQFTMVAPADARLPGGGGYTVTGLYNLKPEKFGQAQNYNTLSDKFGKQIEHWNGVDVTVNARLQNGLTFQAGVSTGKTTEDNCEVVAKLPEMNNVGTPAVWQSGQSCHRETPFLTQVKMYGVYTLPRVDVQVAGTFRSTNGDAINANYTATNAYLAANSTLGRVLSGSAANMSVNLIPQNTQYLDRRNELDLRFGKVLRFGRTRTTANVDVFNALNADAVLTANPTYASWLRPTTIPNARVLKLSFSFNF